MKIFHIFSYKGLKLFQVLVPDRTLLLYQGALDTLLDELEAAFDPLPNFDEEVILLHVLEGHFWAERSE